MFFTHDVIKTDKGDDVTVYWTTPSMGLAVTYTDGDTEAIFTFYGFAQWPRPLPVGFELTSRDFRITCRCDPPSGSDDGDEPGITARTVKIEPNGTPQNLARLIQEFPTRNWRTVREACPEGREFSDLFVFEQGEWLPAEWWLYPQEVAAVMDDCLEDLGLAFKPNEWSGKKT